jgi:hypothetical protein
MTIMTYFQLEVTQCQDIYWMKKYGMRQIAISILNGMFAAMEESTLLTLGINLVNSAIAAEKSSAELKSR